jgi:hypothetical protein
MDGWVGTFWDLGWKCKIGFSGYNCVSDRAVEDRGCVIGWEEWSRRLVVPFSSLKWMP